MFSEIIAIYFENYTECILFKNAIFRRVRKIATTVSFAMSVSQPISMEQLGYQWTDFHEISYLRIFRTSVGKMQFRLQSDKDNRHCI
jgi:hypothetical protein